MHNFEETLNWLAENMPEDWAFSAGVECGNGWVEVENEYGKRLEIDSEASITDQLTQIKRMIRAAQRRAGTGE